MARGGRGDRGLMLVDSHCHLNYKGLAEQQDAVLTRARARGVTAMLNIATRESEWDAVLAAAETPGDVWASVGIHPHAADHPPDLDTARLVARSEEHTSEQQSLTRISYADSCLKTKNTTTHNNTNKP